MSDKLVFDLAQEIEGSPNVFVRKDWLNILDNMNQNYNSNQSVIDTSQLSNSNKYMSYREAYLLMPMVATLASIESTSSVNPLTAFFSPNTAATNADHVLGLKNWTGQLIHSCTLDYNGTTIIQQTPYINKWNSFKLLTSLSLDDINTQGATIGFYPDDATSWQFIGDTAGVLNPSLAGQGTCNNSNLQAFSPVSGAFNNFNSGDGNSGFLSRQRLINFDLDGVVSTSTTTYGNLLHSGASATNQVWKSYIYKKINGVVSSTTATIQGTAGIIQFAITGIIYLKHLHSWFNQCPLLKGVFMKMTMNLNNTTTEFTTVATNVAADSAYEPTSITLNSVSNPLGGVNPLMIASGVGLNGGRCLYPPDGTVNASAGATITTKYRMNIAVGNRCLDPQLNALSTPATPTNAPLSASIYLYIPSYTFNPPFEQAYLDSPVKQIKYTDVYQYQVLSVQPGQNFNNLLTNGLANVKSVLILPFYSPANGATNAANGSSNTGLPNATPVYQSPFDPAGTGPTSPMCWISNFNVQISGQNAIYNTQKYNFEQFNNQLYGQNAVNGGLTDGLTSGLIDRQKFDMNYCYYYVNVERMLPVEMSVPKSIQIIGQNLSAKFIDLYCFVEYGVEVSIDALTGARV